MADWFQDWLSAVALAVATSIGAWLAALSRKLNATATRVAILDSRCDDMPALLKEIKNEISALRLESKERGEALYTHIEAMRREFKDDLKGKADK
jgi:hypothetical protein